jgi:hypothetical protein
VISPESSLEDVCYAVSTALERAGIEAVLTGGRAVTVYVPASYQSLDADFVLTFAGDRKKTEHVLQPLGFRRSGRLFVHDRNQYSVEFPSGPLAVGDDLIEEHAMLRRDGESLRILTPTDCVRDRLASAYYWQDSSALQAAVAVARRHAIDLRTIETWSEHEAARFPGYRQLDSLRRFLEALA